MFISAFDASGILTQEPPSKMRRTCGNSKCSDEGIDYINVNGYFLDIGRPRITVALNTRYRRFWRKFNDQDLVTGAAGYIGTVLVERLLAANEFDVVALDSLMYGQTPFATEFSNQRFEFVNADVRDSRVVSEHANSADVIIPLAALVGAPICAKDPHTADAVNKAAV